MEVKTTERPINIKSLVIEEPHRKPEEFDARTFLSEQEWREAVEVLSDQLITDDLVRSQLHTVIALKRLNLDAFSQFRHAKSVDLYRLMENMARWRGDDENTLLYLEFCKEVLPEQFEKRYRQIRSNTRFNLGWDEFWKQEEQSLSRSSTSLSACVVSFRTAFPSKGQPDLGKDLPDVFLGEISKLIEDKSRQFDAVWAAANFTILFPERKGELGILSKWDKYLAYAHENKNRAQYNYLLPALHSLQILKSKETRFTEDGLKIIMPEPKEFDMAEQELPETRKF
ncbi:hypothetical protein A3A60_01535 [Candidatus Curtissbacteria bacterium RIFCSPLOWO2_01_FULL_42_26]|uniref:Uncharacterized protein n=1 Tax=Candidatus Curtissbacteria bacterium RIFCSPLOWO2_01_FULL_42_26 TaxID=1797729 RepID=A0A1F5HZP3_9BACT|nr:MAG: hypothetical protein A3A60_01535 [Candidatus Curtissbacteria bacterium RIFCSPLOWO2_01_FULL_42_26]